MRWGGLVVSAIVGLAGAGVAAAQDTSKDQELEAIKKRLEVLEQEKAQRDAADQAAKDAKEDHGADPAETKWYDRVTIGGGIRTEFRIREEGANDGQHTSNRFALDDARLYLGAKVTDLISVELNTAVNGGVGGGIGDVNILDAIVKFHFQDEFNIWFGRMLPPTDRSNLDGPFYLLTWDFPFTSRYISKFDGRDDGGQIWGDLMGGKFKYQVGVFNGNIGNAADRRDNLLYAARLTYEVWDPEPAPFYYTASTYYGAKDILAISIVGQDQRDGADSGKHPFRSGDIEVFFEKKVSDLVFTAEVALYDYFLGTNGPAPFEPTGTAVLAQAGLLLPQKIGWGQFQPNIRYQEFHADPGGIRDQEFDLGLNYVISGHNALISLVWEYNRESPKGKFAPGADLIDRELVLGVQVQF